MNEDIIREEELIAREQAEEAEQFSTALIRRPIRTLPTLKPPITVPGSVSVREAVDAMNRGRVGCVLIVRGETLAGVFTERDVLTRVVSRGVDPDATLIEHVMTEDPECLTLDDDIVYALNKMSIGGFRHVPLIDGENRPTGVVAMRNIVDYLVHLFPSQVLNLPPSPALGITRAREGA